MRLYSGPLSMFGAKAEIAAIEKGLDVEIVMVPFDMEKLYEPKHPDVLRVNPKRQIPVLIDAELEIFDSTQIFEYFEDMKPQPPLWPRDLRARARARRIEHESDEVFFPPVVRLMGLQDRPDDPAAIAARAAADLFYDRLEAMIGGKDYLAGEFSYADIAFYMAQFFAYRMGAPMVEEHENLLAWRNRMTARPAVKKVAGAMAEYLVSMGKPAPEFVRS